MADYPTLTEMGITRFNEISHYVLRLEGEDTDVLKVYYRRAKGSFLPHSRKYKFGRSTKSVRVDTGNGGTKEIHEISPFLHRALGELDSLVKHKRVERGAKTELLAEMDHLERVMQSKLAEMRRRIEELG